MFLYMYVYRSLFLFYNTYYMPSPDLTVLKLPQMTYSCCHKYKHKNSSNYSIIKESQKITIEIL